MARSWLAVLGLVAACGGSGSGSGSPPDGPGGHPDGAVDAPVPPGWTTLISRTWSLAPGTNVYLCRRVQVPADMWITGFRALSPPGTHHEVLTTSPTAMETGDYDCSAGLTDPEMLFAAGIGSGDFLLPAGAAIHLKAGQYINLDLHLFNAGDTAISEESGILVQTIDPADVVHEVDMTFAGTYGTNITIPADGQPHVVNGGCGVPADWHVIAVWPHMNGAGIHQALVTTPSGGTPSTLLDTSYTVEEQRTYPVTDTLVHSGDQVQVQCTYVNTTSSAIIFGDNDYNEMCITGIYKYPPGGALYGCMSN